jgi:hypothetical protein
MTKDIFFKSEILEQYLTAKITAARAAKMLNASERQFWRIDLLQNSLLQKV